MPKSLLIVESPAKARTLERYLGGDFIVKASVGHVKDLPGNKLGINLDEQFKPEYQVMHGKKKIVEELKKAAAKADAIYLGPDPDREGEAIAWHIAEEIQANGKPVHRVLFYELTRKAIMEAIAHPSELNSKLYEAQQTRRILDRMVGYMISPLLWEKVRMGLSAGRVQSVALKIICEREKEIQAFETVEYWTIDARLGTRPPGSGSPVKGEGAVADEKAPPSFSAQLMKCKKKKCEISSGEEAESHLKALRPLLYVVSKVEKKERQRRAAPPFITSTLQQDAARKFSYSAKQTMGIAQRLYEGIDVGGEGAVGLITYMRTDSTRLSQDALDGAREFIQKKWGKEYLPAKPVVYKTKDSAQGAHEAIRPTDVTRTPESIAGSLSREQLKLYTLIWKRFVACQMAPARIDQTTIDISAGDYTFRATGSIVSFPGFLALYEEGKDEPEEEKGDMRLPDLSEGQALDLLGLDPKQHFTQPPPRYSEATLIKTLEELGIGRPSTYATIVSTIIEREYVVRQKQRLSPTELGLIINKLLEGCFPNIVDVDFTANMEKSLDGIEKGADSYLHLLTEFYEGFSKTMATARTGMLNLKSVGWPTPLNCPLCEKALKIRFSKSGPYLACSGYPQCSYTSNYERDEKGHIHPVERQEQETGEVCDKCGSAMLLKHGRYGNFLACSGYPKCKSTRPVSSGIACPREECAGNLVERMSRRGRFYGCSKYPDCKMLFQGEPVREECPQCKSPVLFRRAAKTGAGSLYCINPACKFKKKEEPEEDLASSGKKTK